MSKTIEERIVSMKFDNKDFEKNASTSMSTLDKLKSALSFKGASKGLSEVGNSVKGFNLQPLLSAVDSVNNNFSVMGRICTGALENIGAQAIQTGEQMIKSLSIDPIKDGFDEYELKINSVQNILNSARDADGNSVGLDVVKQKLEELNTYADKTIYSFSDMTSNISKFTNAGVDLDRAVAAIQGISNEAALSGANATQASHAMYNFAQALSSGYVQLLDWKSIQYATMDTVEFKEALLEAGEKAGTLAKNLDGTYTILTTNNQGKLFDGVINASQHWNESLAYQWMTADVLVDTLGRYANELDPLGEKAFKAATEVKTFSQMMDTLRESVGSGWAQTWEIVFGDYYTAKDLWTGIYNFINGFISRMSDARNALLTGWASDELGGRAAAIAGIKNTLNGILSIVKPIKEAFRDVFPPTTSEQLVKISKSFQQLTSKFALGDKQINNIKSTFHGLFSVLDIIVHTFGTLFGYVEPVAKVALHLVDELLTKLGPLGEKLYTSRDAIKGIVDSKITDGVQLALSKFGELADTVLPYVKVAEDAIIGFIEQLIVKLRHIDEEAVPYINEVKESVAKAVDSLKDAVERFKDLDLSGFETFSEKVRERLHPVQLIFDAIGWLITKAKDIVVGGLPLIATGISKFMGLFGTLAVNFAKSLKNVDFDKLVDLVNTGAIILFIKKFADLVDSTSKGITDFASAFKSAGKTLDQVRVILEIYQKSLKANILIKIAAAVMILAGALIALALMDSKKLATALAAMGLLSLMLSKMMANITGLLDVKKMAGAGAAGTMMMELAIAISIMVNAIIKMGELDWQSLAKGLVGFGAILAGLTLFLDKGKLYKADVAGAFAVIFVAEAIKMIADAILDLAGLNLEQIGTGLLGFAGIIAGLVLFMNTVNKSGGLDDMGIRAGLSIMMLAESIRMISDAVISMGQLDLKQLGTGLLGLGAILAGLVIFLNTANFKEFGVMDSVGLVLIAQALRMLVEPIQTFSQMSVTEIAKGLITLGVALAEITVAMNFMQGSIGGGVAMILIAQGLNMMLVPLKTFSQMSIGEIAKGLIGIAATFAVLGAAALILAPIVPVLLGLGAALTLIGSGVALAGVGLSMLAAALPALATGLVVATGAIGSLVAELIDLFPTIAVAFVNSIVHFITGIAGELPKIITVLGKIVDAILEFIQKEAPKLMETIMVLLDEFLVKLAEHFPSILESVGSMLLALLNYIGEHISDFTQAGVNIILGFIDGLTQKIGDIVQAAWNIVIALIEGLAAAFGNEDNIIRLREAILDLLKSMLEAVLTFFGIHSPSTVFQDIGVNLIDGLINGLGSMAEAVVNKIKEIGQQLVDAVKEKLTDFFNKGKEIIENIKGGIDNVKDTLKTKFTGIIDGLKDFDVSGFTEAGKNILNGLKKGIEDNDTFQNLKTATDNTFVAVRKRIAEIFDENSPSKVTYGFGKYVVIGFANGIRAVAGEAINAADEFGEGTLDSMRNAVSSITNLIENGMDSDPTIRPVLDLSNVSAGVNDLNSMINSDRSIALAASASYGANSVFERNQNGLIVNNRDVVRSISDLRSDMHEMANAIRELQIVMDTGTLVGSIVEPMDQAFGRLRVRNERGI